MKGVNRYYGLDRPAKLLLIGHSHLMLATDKERLERELGAPVAKYCREGVNVTDRKAMVQHYLNSGMADSLQTVLYGVDLYTFTGEGLSKNSYQLFYPFVDNPYIDQYLRSQAAPSDYWLHRLVKTTRFNSDGLKNSVWRGWADNWSNFKENTIDTEAYRRNITKTGERPIEMNDTLIREFKETVKMLTDRGIRVVMVNTPTLDVLNDWHGDNFRRITDWYRDYAATDSLIEYWDYNPVYSSDHSIFSDRIHLNARGQQQITTDLISRLKPLIN